eukprot:CCRYP_010406-RA/>CCRYP_010406-RA protein AED:0.04 eAED:0.04 QI:451/1/1/1/1/1/3/884/508
MPYLNHDDLRQLAGPQVDLDPARMKDRWLSVSEDVEFLPLMTLDAMTHDTKLRPHRARSLGDQSQSQQQTATGISGAYANYDPYSVQPFIEGMSNYNEYQQAWRLLGFMIDCNTVIYDDDDGRSNGGSRDQQLTEDGCSRYVLWAAYVDTGYEGGGIGEYQYWDADSQSWDDTPCYYAKGNGGHQQDNQNGDAANGNGQYNSRCAKMDCHLEDTHFSVLGFFKHRNYDDWMEQLFKHEGMCVWSDEEYAFMKRARKAWPRGCASTGTTISGADGNASPLYYDIRPLRNGRIAVGLYTDEQCITEYPASTSTVEGIVGNIFLNADNHDNNNNYDFSGDSFAESMNRWDSAFDIWRTCHPCVAYDLENTDGTKYYTDDDDGYYDDGGRRKRKLGGNYKAQGDVFECYDDAGYTNVNQCMKFSAKTVMKTATFRDLSLGMHQGTLAENPLSGYFDASQQYRVHTLGNVATYLFLVATSAAFILSVLNFFRVVKRARRRNVGEPSNSESLLL